MIIMMINTSITSIIGVVLIALSGSKVVAA